MYKSDETEMSDNDVINTLKYMLDLTDEIKLGNAIIVAKYLTNDQYKNNIDKIAILYRAERDGSLQTGGHASLVHDYNLMRRTHDYYLKKVA